MADTQEFLDDQIRLYKTHANNWASRADNKTPASNQKGRIVQEIDAEFKEAILQHFQQEQEKKPVRSIPIPFPSLYATDKEYLNAKEAYDKKVEEQWAGAERLYTQSEVDRLIREAEDKVVDWFDDGLPSGFTTKEWYVSYRFAKERLSKQEEGGREA